MLADSYRPKKRELPAEDFKDYLYPETAPYKEDSLLVSEPGEQPEQKLYIAEYGNPKGEPIIVLHGGPGGGSEPFDARYYDPRHYRIILFDQRGSGKSTPPAETRNNTIWHLIDDIDKIRRHVGIKDTEKVHLSGGSWGSTLAVAYAISHPDRVKSMTLRGFSTCRRVDDDYFYQGNAAVWHKSENDPERERLQGVGRYFPEAWEQYVEFIPQEERGDMVAAYWKRMSGKLGPELQKEAQIRWTVLESATSFLKDKQSIKELREEAEKDGHGQKIATLECLYFYRGAFSHGEETRASYENNYILDNLHKIIDIPTQIVGGKYDQVCPPNQTRQFIKEWKALQSDEKKWPQYYPIADAGHSRTEPGIAAKLIEITDRFLHLPKDRKAERQ